MHTDVDIWIVIFQHVVYIVCNLLGMSPGRVTWVQSVDTTRLFYIKGTHPLASTEGVSAESSDVSSR